MSTRENIRLIARTPLLTLKAHITKIRILWSSAEIFEAFSTNSVCPDQSDPGQHCLLLYIF